MNNKKEKERLYLNFLLEYLQYNYKELENSDDNPDFKLIIKNKRIGIELTRVFNITEKPSLMAVESEQRKIANKLLELLNKAVLPKIDVRLYFVPSKSFPQKINQDKYAWRLFNLILDNFPRRNSQFDVKTVSLVPRELISIGIARFDFIEDNCVSSGFNGWVIKDFNNLLQNTIDKKVKKIPGYDKTCYEFWLLIYSDGSSGAAMFKPSGNTLEHIYTSKFERVFFISSIGFQTYELKIKQI